MDENQTPSAATPETPPTLPTPQVEMAASVPVQAPEAMHTSAQPTMTAAK